MRASSSSTTEPRIAGFRLVREVARHGTTVTYEAVQLDLERPVSLTLLAPGDPRAGRFRADAWPEHPHVSSLYAAGDHQDGFAIATRLVPGATTLRRRIADGADPTAWLATVRAALATTGVVHGGLDDETSLLVDGDGRVFITGFGLAPADATAADDERALRRLVDATGVRARPRPRNRRSLFGAAGTLAIGLPLLLAAVSGDDGAPPAGPDALAPGAVALGSALAAGPDRTVDCDGEPPSGRSLACTAMQSALPGSEVIVPRDGVVIAWHVRGARGDVALRVIRPRSATRFGLVGGSDFETVDEGLHSFRAAVPVRRGDRFGLELAPGAAAGFRTGVPGATTSRFIDPLKSESRRPNPPAGAGRDEELLLRVEYAPGRTIEPPARLTGAAAAAAPDGRRRAERELDVTGGDTVTVTVVALPGGVAVDLFDGSVRRARITVPGADPRGRPERFTAKGEADLTLAWRNPDGRGIETPYRVTARSIAAGR
jgi:hypothetical protein